MPQHERTLEIGEGARSGDVFEFPMTLATEGEAADGHILSIEGGRIGSRIPLLTSHMPDPTMQLGSITKPERDLTSSPKKLRATGLIELTGDGAGAEIRRDLAHMIGLGHVRAVSIRWDALKQPVSRRELPPEHPAHVKDGEADYRKKYGMYFESWRALEGSVVAVGADPKALIGRAEELGEGATAQFWRSLALDSEPPALTPAEIRGKTAEAIAEARAAGIGWAELYTALSDVAGDEWPLIEGTSLRAPAAIAALLVRDEPESESEPVFVPPPAARPTVVVPTADSLRALLAEHREKSRQELAEMLRRATGRPRP